MNDNKKTPQHIAIIMDGNGRWAKKRNQNRIQGHIKAKKSVRDCIECCIENKIKYLIIIGENEKNKSNYTLKNMSAGEGGAIVSNNKDFIDKCFSYHNCGRTTDGQFYDHHLLGGNFRLNAIAASMLIPQMKSILKDMDIRDKNRNILDS